MTEGFEEQRNGVGPGWQSLIEQLDTDLQKIVPGYSVVQIKEKFGGLRYYISMTNGNHPEKVEAAWKLTDAAEAESYKICEECGTRENVSTEGRWMRTLCPTDRGAPDVHP